MTRDFKFKHLFSSTLFENELDLCKMFNKNNVAFQYDFLNDDIDINPDNAKRSKLYRFAPELVEAMLSDKPLVFYQNPPYATSGDLRFDSVHHKAGVANSATHDLMKEADIGHASENLYSQFFYRCNMFRERFHLSHVVLATFTKSQFMAGGNYFGKLTDYLFSRYEYKSGFLLNAGEFNDTSSEWGISFTILESRNNQKYSVPEEFPLTVKAIEPRFGVINISEHMLQNLDTKDFLSKWVRDALPKAKEIDWCEPDTYPTFTSAFKTKEKSAHKPPKYPKEALGYAWNKANNVEKSKLETALFSACYRDGNGFPIMKENFDRVIINFAIRKATKHSWIFDKDNYSKPSRKLLDDPKTYNQVLADCVVYSLFNTYSYQVSLKNVEYKNNLYDIKNQFFWLTKQEIGKIAAENKNSDMGFEIMDDDERFVASWLNSHREFLSNEAKIVLTDATNVLKETFRYRVLLDEDYPEFNLLRWDAGWEQIRRIIHNTKASASYNDYFKPSYNNLEQKINGYIYDYGFLKR
ncbi:hypothetical protein [Lactobacillus corticis]|uniref:Uncharacterized protein n=1 Tax=Lactobacillus corticis TaxID=2201249 RepID=A0A916QL08_9LACO|nr:hypothetical protein [Lactobacillus corticis]GFZ27426.1 hypothetical protein LCB40_13060 [Lactobacillus corticis]